jgi:eukaryotic-like serine/threonine-protein kinase
MTVTEGIAVGQVLAGKYRVERQLGAGGMGYVLLASHLGLHQRVALKLLHGELGDVPQALSRFMQEGRTAARLRSEHVGKVLDVGRLPTGEAYLVMEYLEGHDLATEVAERGPMPIQTAVGYVLQACEAIAEAHAYGIVHRDLKPANLFLARTAYGDRCVKVLDFGISKIRSDANFVVSSPALTGSHTIMGSPSYMAPEQMRASRDVDGRTDVWALGTILYELITGSTAFNGDTLAIVCSAVLNDSPQSLSAYRSDLPAGLQDVVMRCLEKQPGRRFSAVVELVRELVPFGPANCSDAVERIGRLVGDIAPDQVCADAAMRALPTPPLSGEGVVPPTLSMLLGPSGDAVGTSQRFPNETTAPGTGVVWSGTDLGIASRSVAKRSLVIGAALVALVAAFVSVLRMRGASSPSVASAGAPMVSVGSRTAEPAAAQLAERNGLAPASAQGVPLSEPPATTRPQAAAASTRAQQSLEPKPRGLASASVAVRPLASDATLPRFDAKQNTVETVAAKPDPPKVEPITPSHSSRVTDFGGRE